MKITEKQNATIVEVPIKEIDKLDFASCNEPLQTLENFKKTHNPQPDILLNGGFFNMTTKGDPVNDFIDDGVQKANDTTWNSYGIGITKNNKIVFGRESDGNWKDFLTACPPIVINGKYDTMGIGKNSTARRSIIGFNETSFFLITIDSPGATFYQAGKIALDAGCKYAMLLDGGGSTRMICGDKTYAAAKINRPVDNVIAVYLKKEKTIYRVQLGAFLSQKNASVFCEQIKGLDKQYVSAYVRKVGIYYKVQVGAFSIKENAERMMQDLKNRGYNAFITTK